MRFYKMPTGKWVLEYFIFEAKRKGVPGELIEAAIAKGRYQVLALPCTRARTSRGRALARATLWR